MATFIPPVQQVGTVSLVQIGSTVGAGKVRRIDLRASNIHASADQAVDVYINDSGTPANSGYRCRNYPVPFNQASSAPDLEYGLILTVGQSIQVRASAASAVVFSLTQVEDDA